jgi:hypothetical protein
MADARAVVSQQRVAKQVVFDGKACEVCGTKTRRMTRPRWWICLKGHRLVRKSK